MGYNPFALDGKTILVTGASSGIGKSAAIECSRLGARVIITARDENRLKQTLSEMEGEGHEMIICDLSDTRAIERMVEALPEIHGLVNNAGFTKNLPIQFIDEDSLKDLLQVDTIAPILLLKHLVKKRKLGRGSSVVFTSSISGVGRVALGNSMYASCKGALSAFVRGAAKELASKKIRVNAVCPAMVETGILSSGVITDEQLAQDLQRYPLKRYGRPEDVAYAMIYLLSDASSWVTGSNIVLDGGSSLN